MRSYLALGLVSGGFAACVGSASPGPVTPSRATAPADAAVGATSGSGEGGIVAGRSNLPVPPGGGVAKPSGTAANLRVLDWAGFKAAATYSLDDSQPSQIQHYTELQAAAIPLTFYLVSNASSESGFVATWTQAAKDGHELGNHTVAHCHADLSGCKTVGSNEAEIEQCNAYIESTFGVPGVYTMAYPFGDTGWEPFAKPRFFLARGVFTGMVAPQDATDPFNLPIVGASGGEAASVFNGYLDQAEAGGKWVIFLFHSILPTPDNWFAGVDISTITGSIAHGKSLGDVWLDTVVHVGAYWVGQKLLASTSPRSSGSTLTWTWTLPAHFPPQQYVRVKVDGGTLTQGGTPLLWDAHGYYEVLLDAGSLQWSP